MWANCATTTSNNPVKPRSAALPMASRQSGSPRRSFREWKDRSSDIEVIPLLDALGPAGGLNNVLAECAAALARHEEQEQTDQRGGDSSDEGDHADRLRVEAVSADGHGEQKHGPHNDQHQTEGD